MIANEMVSVQLIAISSHLELRKELLKLKSSTEKEIVATARAFEAVKTSRDKLGTEIATQTGAKKYGNRPLGLR